jgi:DNA-binding GntR family transcriptional regulator
MVKQPAEPGHQDKGPRLLRPPTTQEAVLLALRESIATGELQPGERLYQDAIAEQMSVSRVPVREALNVLRADGQLEYSPHRGYWVSALSLDAVEEINLIRGLLETEAIRRAILDMEEDLVEHMDELNEEMAEANQADDVPAFVRLNHELHFALFDRSGLPRLRQHIESLWKSADVYRTSTFNDGRARKRMLSEHKELIEACRERDPIAAVRIMDAHRNKAVETLSTLLREKDTTGGVGPDSDPTGPDEAPERA